MPRTPFSSFPFSNKFNTPLDCPPRASINSSRTVILEANNPLREEKSARFASNAATVFFSLSASSDAADSFSSLRVLSVIQPFLFLLESLKLRIDFSSNDSSSCFSRFLDSLFLSMASILAMSSCFSPLNCPILSIYSARSCSRPRNSVCCFFKRSSAAFSADFISSYFSFLPCKFDSDSAT